MFSILNPDIEKYLHHFSVNNHSDVLRAMEQLAAERKFPIVGPSCGKLLLFLARLMNAKRVFEFGSGFGYSAYWFAEAVGKEGKVLCTDTNEKNKQEAEGFLSKANLWDRIEYHIGKAQDVFSRIDGSFDIIYNDADKGSYPHIFELACKRLSSGGLYIADNALWHGNVVAENVVEKKHPGWNEAIKKHNQMIYDHSDFDVTLLPLRDGIIVARKK